MIIQAATAITVSASLLNIKPEKLRMRKKTIGPARRPFFFDEGYSFILDVYIKGVKK